MIVKMLFFQLADYQRVTYAVFKVLKINEL